MLFYRQMVLMDTKKSCFDNPAYFTGQEIGNFMRLGRQKSFTSRIPQFFTKLYWRIDRYFHYVAEKLNAISPETFVQNPG